MSSATHRLNQWCRQDFVTGGSEVWVYSGSRVRSPPVPVVLSVFQRGSLLDGLAMYLSCDTKKFHDNESTHILHNFWTSIHKGEASPLPPGGATGQNVTVIYYTSELCNSGDLKRNVLRMLSDIQHSRVKANGSPESAVRILTTF